MACQNVVRYYKQNADETWFDVSLNSLLPGSVLNCQRQVSGCLIQKKPNGYSKIRNGQGLLTMMTTWPPSPPSGPQQPSIRETPRKKIQLSIETINNFSSRTAQSDEDKSSQFEQSSYVVNHLWELCEENDIDSATAQCNCYCSEIM
ncbi:uncharacterized LOC100192604 [Zea mays]|uniref:Uncharacterized protein n=1 Tax=Zea mays TaxID=4577 RepID=B4FBY9_MAIZE|nr:uncharacterized LOC100192604 [Zea mays]ACF79632.1 unknown [Zea mays]|eukprot:NP_001131291.1 uncharacterized protein LOC100192604 [Zea mays]